MAKKDMDDFIDTLRSNGELARAFAEAVAGMARDAGHDVTEEDVLEKFVDGDTPSPRPMPGDDDFDGGVTTAALGEEGSPRPRPTSGAIGEEEGGRGSPSVTMAIGEEDRRGPKPPRRGGGGITTMAMGEEGGPRF